MAVLEFEPGEIFYTNETRQYNSLGQMTNLNSIVYNYLHRHQQRKDHIANNQR